MNAGVCAAEAAFGQLIVPGSDTDERYFARLGGVSLLLTIVNIACIVIAGYAYAWVRRIGGAHKTNTLLMFAQTTNTMVRGPDGEKFREQLAEEVKALGKDIRIRSALQDNELQRERHTSAGAQSVPQRPALDSLVQRMRREKSWRDVTRNQPEPGQSYADTVRKGIQIGSPHSPSNCD